MLTEAQKLDRLTSLAIELNRVADLDLLMERVLSEARRFVNADAGSIYICENGLLHFSYTQNATLEARLDEGEKLIYSTFSIPIDVNSIAGCVACTGQILNIPDVYTINPDHPFHFSSQFDEASGYRTRSMLTIPLMTARDVLLGVLQIINAENEQGGIVPFSRDDEKMMQHFASIATVALERARMTRAMILRTIGMAEMRDPLETGAHVNRVGAYSVEIYQRWAVKNGIPQEEIDANRDVLRMAAMLHDVGKVGISDAILRKPGSLTSEEFEIMKTHPILGAQLFKDKESEFDDAAIAVALTHHERWDGLGYPGHVELAAGETRIARRNANGGPAGKKGEEIPLFGRVVAIADVYDALMSRRIYKPAWKEEDALAAIREGRGTRFDPELTDAFFSCIDVIRSIRRRYPDKNNGSG